MNNLLYSTITLINVPKIHTDLLWDLTLLFCGIALVFFIAIFLFRNKFTLSSQKIIERKRELSPIISEFVFYSENSSKEEKSTYLNNKILIRELLKDDFNRKVLSSILLDLKKDVAGETQQQLITLYKDLGLHEDAYKKLKSWRWERISQGILELTQMQVAESYQLLSGFLNDKRSIIRKQAEIATITLKHEGISFFLDTTTYKISEWQQLNIMDVLKNLDGFNPPKFKAWLTSKNKYVVLFALRLIKFYKQNDARTSLIELVKHRDNQIKEEAIGCLKEFNVIEAVSTLKQVFWRCSTGIKISILGAISVLGDKNDVEFLKQIEHKRLDFSVKSKAISTINTILPETVMPTEGIEDITNNAIPENELIMDSKKVEKEIEEQINEQLPHDIAHEEQDVISYKGEMVEKEIAVTEDSGEEILSDKDSLIFDFLPIVVSIEEETPQEEFNINEIELEYEEIHTDQKIETFETSDEQYDNSPELEEEDLSFLPFVIDSNTNSDISEDKEGVETFDDILKGLEIIYEEVKIDRGDTINLNIADHKTPEEVTEEKEELLELNSYDVEFEEVISSKKLNGETEEYIDWPSEVEPLFDDKSDDRPKETPIEDQIKNEFSQIPQSYDFDEDTTSLIHLLTDIEELGDQREIPFLTELLSNQTNVLMRERIEEIIYQFNSLETTPQHSVSIEKELDENLKYSVFEELFSKCDNESKLILMNEMLAIGDEKEVYFLKKLVQDKDVEIREQAEVTLMQLQKKLMLESPCEIETDKIDFTQSLDLPKLQDDSIGEKTKSQIGKEELLVFSGEFSVENSKNATDSTEEVKKNHSPLDRIFLNQLRTIHHKIFDRLNG